MNPKLKPPLAPVVVGLDLALNHTGIAHADGTTETFVATADKQANAGLDRMCEIRRHITWVTDIIDLELVVIEALAFDAHDYNRWLAQLTGIIRASLYDRDVPFIVVTPSTLKKYATGSGRSGKAEVLYNARDRLGYKGFSHDEADALWLRAIGWAVLNVPAVDVPKLHQQALVAVRGQVPVRR
jgi:Holliday junction resolvasome RuvABC endonuclease subunit